MNHIIRLMTQWWSIAL